LNLNGKSLKEEGALAVVICALYDALSLKESTPCLLMTPVIIIIIIIIIILAVVVVVCIFNVNL